MWIASGILFFLFAFIGMLLVLPTQVIVQSRQQEYCIRIPFYFTVRVIPGAQVLTIKGRVFFIPFSFGVDDFFKSDTEVSWPVKEGRKIRNMAPRVKDGWQAAKEMYRAVTVHHLYAQLDTGDYPLNAKLIPVASVLQKPNIAVQVNFVNNNWVDALVYTRLYKIGWILFKNLRTKK